MHQKKTWRQIYEGKGGHPPVSTKELTNSPRLLALRSTPSKTGCQKTQTEGTKETDGHQQEAYTSRTRTQGSMGGRQMRALRRAQEQEATAISPRRVGK
ncbi:hypothetical protein TIFTF001_028156 [Ficus carica]|uniref:Uncharacterized protein n=1 Tax=Ficus carica TaxID=3494 RepID=A0AA88DPA7_FICCA|nr:hypothetical protein TIFTF001_028156 [Ficus carica]